MPEIVLPTDVINVGKKLRLKAITLDHSALRSFEIFLALQQQIIRSDGIIPEYFEPELKQLENNPYAISTTNIERFMPYFRFISDFALRTGKDSYVMDPAHNFDFSYIKFSGAVVDNVTFYGSLMGLIFAANKSKIISRRTAINSAITTPLIATLANGALAINGRAALEETTENPIWWQHETIFRRTVAAQGIADLAEEVDTDPTKEVQNLLVFYPKTHWKAIKYLVQNPEFRKILFEIYTSAINQEALVTNIELRKMIHSIYTTISGNIETPVDSLFSRRHYTPKQIGDTDFNEWKLVTKKTI